MPATGPGRTPRASALRRADAVAPAVGIANWGTLTGALCFAVAGVMQFYEVPD